MEQRNSLEQEEFAKQLDVQRVHIKRRKRRSMLITFFTCVLAIFAIMGFIRLNANMSSISNTYRHMKGDIYVNNDYIERLERLLHSHQHTLYHYMVTENPNDREHLQAEAEGLERKISQLLQVFGENMKDTEYEAYYHKINSAVMGYMNNVSRVFYFMGKGDQETAAYYMSASLSGDIHELNENLDKLDNLLDAQMEKENAVVSSKMRVSRIESVVFTVFLFILALVTIILCGRVADEITNLDGLTGVRNYGSLLQEAKRLEASGKLKEYTVLAVSIRNFKFFNQEYGSNVGDEVLVQYADALSKMLENGEYVGRNGADNFIIFMKHPDEARIMKVVKNIRVKIPMESGGFTMPAYSRCGICEATEDSTVNALVDAAQMALGATRSVGAESVVWFKDVMYERLRVKKRTLENYSVALRNKEFMAFYQPKVDMRTGTLVGAEGLARWLQDGRIIPPGQFVPFLEEEGRLEELDFYIFDNVCRDIREWLDEGLTPVRVSSNFSKLHLKNVHFAEKVLEIVHRYNIDTKWVEVELTESSGYEDYDALEKFTQVMKENGISVAIDDFGTGYSSLSMLKNLDADVVKLDRSFLFGVGADETDVVKKKLIMNIIQMIQDLNRGIICEGVESRAQVDFLLSAGCTDAQGFYYDRPLPKDDFEERLHNPKYDK